MDGILINDPVFQNMIPVSFPTKYRSQCTEDSKNYVKYNIDLVTSVADPGCLSRIPDPDFYPSRIPDPKTAMKDRVE
jgi:hypothetical protein